MVLAHVAATDAFGIALGLGQIARVNLLDLELGRTISFIRVADSRIAQGVIDIVVSDRVARPQVRVLKNPNVGNVQFVVVGRQSHSEGVAPRRNTIHNCCEVVRLGDKAGRVDTGCDLRRINDLHLERSLIDHVQVVPVAA